MQIWNVAHIIRGVCVTSALLKAVAHCAVASSACWHDRQKHVINPCEVELSVRERTRARERESDSLQLRVHLSPNSPLTTVDIDFEWGPSHMGSPVIAHTHTRTHE